MGRGAGGSVSCVSDVYSNTAQAGLHTAGSFHKHEWSPVVDRTHPAGGNLICNILSNSERLRGGREPRGDKLLRVTRRLTDQKKQKKKSDKEIRFDFWVLPLVFAFFCRRASQCWMVAPPIWSKLEYLNYEVDVRLWRDPEDGSDDVSYSSTMRFTLVFSSKWIMTFLSFFLQHQNSANTWSIIKHLQNYHSHRTQSFVFRANQHTLAC